jgi:hypothetical protein
VLESFEILVGLYSFAGTLGAKGSIKRFIDAKNIIFLIFF